MGKSVNYRNIIFTAMCHLKNIWTYFQTSQREPKLKEFEGTYHQSEVFSYDSGDKEK